MRVPVSPFQLQLGHSSPLWVLPRCQAGPALLAPRLVQPHSPTAMALAAPQLCPLPGTGSLMGSGTIAATPGCHGLWGCPAPSECPQCGHWSLVGGTMSCIPPTTLVWFSSSFPLIDTQSGAATVGVPGGVRWYRAPAARAEVEVSVAPRSPALAPRGVSGWERRPPGPNEVVRSARCGALCLPAPWLGNLASGLSLVVGGDCWASLPCPHQQAPPSAQAPP